MLSVQVEWPFACGFKLIKQHFIQCQSPQLSMSGVFEMVSEVLLHTDKLFLCGMNHQHTQHTYFHLL